MADDHPQDQTERDRIFKSFDANGDGKISAAELGHALNQIGSISSDEVQYMMKEIDTDGDGFISFEEFTHFARANRGLIKDVDHPQDQAERDCIFKSFDTNGDGKISAAELGHALNQIGSVSSDEVQYMMKEIDTDGDGFISFEEFTDFARANRGLIKDVAKIFH